MTRLKLSIQINLIFSTVTIIASLIFLFVLNLAFSAGYRNQNKIHLEAYYRDVLSEVDVNSNIDGTNIQILEREFNDYVIIRADTSNVTHSNNFLTVAQANAFGQARRREYFGEATEPFYEISYRVESGVAYMGEVFYNNDGIKVGIFVVSNVDAYIRSMAGNVPLYATLAFMNILILGYIIIWLWSSQTVNKLKKLQLAVEKMSNDNYQTTIFVSGEDEIAELAHSIDQMREEIRVNEKTKREMIQNIGHDLKTPIAVIKSYAEAIEDGITEPKQANIIIKQADILNERIKKLVELNKIEYLSFDEPLIEVHMKEVIMQVVDNYKYTTPAQIKVDLDDSKHPMIVNNFYIAIANIIDNAIRYVETEIRITLKNKKLTIYNDGEQVDPAFLPKIFKAYEKDSRGEFGLGLAITKTTLNRFGLQIYAENVDKGVMFVIEPI